MTGQSEGDNYRVPGSNIGCPAQSRLAGIAWLPDCLSATGELSSLKTGSTYKTVGWSRSRARIVEPEDRFDLQDFREYDRGEGTRE